MVIKSISWVWIATFFCCFCSEIIFCDIDQLHWMKQVFLPFFHFETSSNFRRKCMFTEHAITFCIVHYIVYCTTFFVCVWLSVCVGVFVSHFRICLTFNMRIDLMHILCNTMKITLFLSFPFRRPDCILLINIFAIKWKSHTNSKFMQIIFFPEKACSFQPIHWVCTVRQRGFFSIIFVHFFFHHLLN